MHLEGLDCAGSGEDVSQDRDPGPAAVLDASARAVVGKWRFRDFTARLAATGLSSPRRWALESAGLALGLAQAGCTLAEILDRELEPVRFVLHALPPGRLPLDQVVTWHRRCRELRFALDADESWDDELIATLSAMERVEVVDFRSYERDPMPPVELFQRVSYALPDAILEDAALTEETKSLLLEHPGPLSWDAAIYSSIEIEALAPQALNMRPTRFGWWKRLLDAYDLCQARGVRCYAGRSGELGVGLRQLQYLASLFHPAEPNQVAPAEVLLDGEATELPNPLPVSAFASAFGRPG